MTSSTIPIPEGLSEAPDDVLQAMTRAYGALPEKRYDEARQGFQAALALAETHGSRWGAILAKHQLANVMFNLRRDAECRRLHDEVLAEGRALDSVWIVASSLGNIGNVDAVDGRLDDARAAYRASIEAYLSCEQEAWADIVGRSVAHVERMAAAGRLTEAFAHLRGPA